ncbi:NADH dehydrogenase, FAD-containing subunit [Actinopolyspora alba]|uniref:NADH dehydrogenase, FAD-containing subunit n=1 Tax=Actinopolyspora alba TaxID=673379 RepID=A0A1I1TQP0_9ACTN|nr:FAD-dependent oxidoreductase [Actinopolyspora alba]SFD60715.1 NADH dehydrogenase, FAD-containing subunit [Actinopolyspora alba]
MTATVVVVGGGYGGITAARAIDEFAEVVLVEPRDTFVHNVAALRALVEPSWLDLIFLPYDNLLGNGRVIRDRAVRVDHSAVTLASGERIEADYVVLATGSSYPFPAKVDVTDSALAVKKLRTTHDALADSRGVLLLGAGPAGLELAGEIKHGWPNKSVTVVDPAPEPLSAVPFPAELRAELRRQLDELGVELSFGNPLAEQPPSEPGEPGAFSVTTRPGERIDADLWFRCYGVVPTSGYLDEELAVARREDGALDVTSELRLPGQDHVFAIGDLTSIPEAKTAKAAELHAGVVAANIRALADDEGELTRYEPAPPAISLPLGPAGGVSYSPSAGVLGAERTSRLKGTSMRREVYTALLNLDG